MLAKIIFFYGIALTIAVPAGAFWKGDREEQLTAGAVLVSLAITLATRDTSWAGTQWGAFAPDLVLLALLVAISLRTSRYWPLAAAAFQLLCVITHVARMLDPGVRAWAYATGQVIWSQMVLWALAVGVWNTWRAGRRASQDEAPAVR